MIKTPRDLVVEILMPSKYFSGEVRGRGKHINVDDMPDELTISVVLNNLEYALSSLDEREVCILRKRYFEGCSIKASGKKIVNYVRNPCDGVGTQRANQIIHNAIHKLRRPRRLKMLLWRQ